MTVVFEGDRAALLTAAKRAARLADPRENKRVCISAAPEGNKVILYCGGDGMAIAAKADGSYKVETPLRMGVDASKLVNVLEGLKDDSVKVELKGEKAGIVLKSGRKRFVFAAGGVKTWKFGQFESAPAEVSTIMFRNAVARALKCITKDGRHNSLYGVSLWNRGETLEVVGSNGKILACTPLEYEGDLGFEKVLMPVEAMSHLIRVFEGYPSGSKLKIGRSGQGRIEFLSPPAMIEMLEVAGRYQNYSSFLSLELPYSIEVDTETILEAVKLVNIQSDEDNRPTLWEFKNGELTLVVDERQSAARVTVEGVQTDVPDSVLKFSSRYMIDMLGMLKYPETTIRLGNPDFPARVEGEGFTVSVMPMSMVL